MDIRLAQRLAWENKLAKGFDTTDVPLEFCLLSGELAEAFDAWRTDLQEAVEAKLAANEARTYRRLPNGVLVKDAAASPPPDHGSVIRRKHECEMDER
jgi:hypothetical protein